MGCLAEFFLELFCELIGEPILALCMSLMTMIVPEENIKESTKKKLTNIVKTIAILSFISLFLGVIFWVQDEETELRPVGKYMTLIPLTIIVLNIILGIIGKIISKKKKS